MELLLEKIKKELEETRKEKFNYQSKVIELRKALKSKLVELEVRKCHFHLHASLLNLCLFDFKSKVIIK